ncbi:MAG: hypothetical protein PVJ28_11755, partial [Acidimicrobiia bacterium]
MTDVIHDLLVVGGSPAGLSLAARASRAGLEETLVLALPDVVVPEHAVSSRRLAIRHVPGIDRISVGEEDLLVIETEDGRFSTRVCAIDATGLTGGEPPWAVPSGLAQRFHDLVDFEATDSDVLVVGGGEAAAVVTWQLGESGARVVLSFTGEYEDLSLIARQLLEHLEREQKATVLWSSVPKAVWEVEGFPMVGFGDRRTPDLQFDHVVVATAGSDIHPMVALTPEAAASPGLFTISDSPGGDVAGTRLDPSTAWSDIRKIHFQGLADLAPRQLGHLGRERTRALEVEHYNATITAFDTAHNELWRIRVRPDWEAVAHRAGQYCSL